MTGFPGAALCAAALSLTLAMPALGETEAAQAPMATAPPSSPIVDGQRIDVTPPAAPTPPPEGARARSGAAPPPAVIPRGMTIRTVVVVGASAPAAMVGPASRPFIGRPLSRRSLDGITAAISAAYARTDVALYTIEIPAQDFAGGRVRVRVIEGYIQHVYLTGAGARDDRRLVTAYATHLTAERPLRRSTLQRYLSLIRDIPGLKVQPRLLKGDRDGAVKLVLGLTRRPVEAGLSYDNLGTNALGRDEITLEGDFNSLLRQGDQTKVILAAPSDLEQFQYVAVSHSERIGDDGLTATAQVGYLATRPFGSPLRGQAVIGVAQVAYPLIRAYDRNLYVAGEFDALNADDAAFGAVISSAHTRVFRATLSYGETGKTRTFQAAVTVSQGIHGLGAAVSPLQGSAAFSKLTFQAGLDQTFGKRLVLRLRTAEQLAGAALPASEAFSLGGPGFGRAFPVAYLLGDSGAAGSAELAWIPKFAPRPLAGSELFSYVDGGETSSRARPPLPAANASLASAGAGVRFDLLKKLVITLEAAKPVKSPFPDTSQSWRFIVGARATY